MSARRRYIVHIAGAIRTLELDPKKVKTCENKNNISFRPPLTAPYPQSTLLRI